MMGQVLAETEGEETCLNTHGVKSYRATTVSAVGGHWVQTLSNIYVKSENLLVVLAAATAMEMVTAMETATEAAATAMETATEAAATEAAATEAVATEAAATAMETATEAAATAMETATEAAAKAMETATAAAVAAAVIKVEEIHRQLEMTLRLAGTIQHPEKENHRQVEMTLLLAGTIHLQVEMTLLLAGTVHHLVEMVKLCLRALKIIFSASVIRIKTKTV